MRTLEPTGDHTVKEVSALLREARSLLRRTDKLSAATAAVDDRTATERAMDARTAIKHLVQHLAHVEQQRQRHARGAVRRGR